MPFRRSHGMIYPTQEWNSTSGRLYKRLGTFFLVTDKLSGKRNNFEPVTFSGGLYGGLYAFLSVQ